MQPTWHVLSRDGAALACADFGGEGGPVLLLHGLCGHAEEWRETAEALRRHYADRLIPVDGTGSEDEVFERLLGSLGDPVRP